MIKKAESVCELLGVSQYDLAKILGVSRSAVAMFSAGKRGLPMKATILLADMLKHVDEHRKLERKQVTIDACRQNQKYILSLLSENEFQYLKVINSIANESKADTAQNRLQHLENFLQSRLTSDPSLKSVKRTAISSKVVTANDLDINNLFKLTVYKQLLEQERAVLNSILQSLKKDDD